MSVVSHYTMQKGGASHFISHTHTRVRAVLPLMVPEMAGFPMLPRQGACMPFHEEKSIPLFYVRHMTGSHTRKGWDFLLCRGKGRDGTYFMSGTGRISRPISERGETSLFTRKRGAGRPFCVCKVDISQLPKRGGTASCFMQMRDGTSPFARGKGTYFLSLPFPQGQGFSLCCQAASVR